MTAGFSWLLPRSTQMQLQFNLYSLLVLTTVVAMGCAVARLPIPLAAKLGPIFALALCYYGWSVRNWRYPDPRRPQTISRTSRMARFLIPLAIDIPLFAYLFFGTPWRRQMPILWSTLTVSFLLVTAFRVWSAVKPDPKPPHWASS